MAATRGDALQGQPLVVLVDGGSASGSEIVAGALRDHGRATLMGERTFGKGSVQTVIPLRDGQALKLTTSRYFTPSGVSIHERGLDPDIVIGKLADDERAPVAARPVHRCRTRPCSRRCSTSATAGLARTTPPRTRRRRHTSVNAAPTSVPIIIAMIGNALRPNPSERVDGSAHIAAQVDEPAHEIDRAEGCAPGRAYIAREQPDGRHECDEQFHRVLLHAEVALEHVVSGDGWRLDAVACARAADEQAQRHELHQREHDDDLQRVPWSKLPDCLLSGR
jgi:hypothetical protein